ncbi:MAG: hypothetical protein IK128_07745 [Clostridiales bacterium]|nr:hypothetical protein [Clostridiales bacterium]
MKVLCDYCGNPIDETLATCPECGAVNKHMLRSGNQVPKTIEELQAFIAEHKIPVDKMRFFIGIDYTEPKAFGIFKKDNQNCVVYKNKSDGTRIIRYEGADEAYAVNEIYQKMKAEYLEHRQVMDRRSFFDGGDYGKGRPDVPFTDYRKPAPPPPKEKFKYSRGNNILGGRDGNAVAPAIAALMFLAVVLASALTSCDLTIPPGLLDSLDSYYVEQQDGPDNGYYSYGDDYYYYDDDKWYGLDEDGYWAETKVPDDLDDNYDDYFEDSDYDDLDDNSYFDEYVPYYDTYEYDSGYDYEYDDSWGDDSWEDDDWDYYYNDDNDYDYDYDSDYEYDYGGGWNLGGGGWDSDW